MFIELSNIWRDKEDETKDVSLPLIDNDYTTHYITIHRQLMKDKIAKGTQPINNMKS